jgi:hypothetical protein
MNKPGKFHWEICRGTPVVAWLIFPVHGPQIKPVAIKENIA